MNIEMVFGAIGLFGLVYGMLAWIKLELKPLEERAYLNRLIREGKAGPIVCEDDRMKKGQLVGIILMCLLIPLLLITLIIAISAVEDYQNNSKDSQCEQRFGEGYEYDTFDSGYLGDITRYCLKTDNGEIVDKREVTF